MKNRMLIMLVLLGLVIPSMAQAATRILLLDDIGTGEATFAFVTNNQGGVVLTARVAQACWDQDCEPYLYHSTEPLKKFSRQDHDVFYTGGGTPVQCGDTHGIFQRSQILPTCQVIISPESVCSVWFKENECASTTTKYRVYMTIQKDPRAG